MKKEYIKPEMDVVITELNQQILAGSDRLIFDPSDESEVFQGLSFEELSDDKLFNF